MSPGPYSCRTRPCRMYSMTSKSTWMWAPATPPGGIVATFIDSCRAGTFFADSPTLYWMPFQSRQVALRRITEMPSLPSTCCFRSWVIARSSAAKIRLLDLEPIPDTGLGLQMPRAGRVVLQLVAQLGHVHAQVMRVRDGVRPPHRVQQLTVGEHLPGLAYQCRQQLVLGRGEMHLRVGDEHAPGRQIDAQIAGGEHRLIRRPRPGGVPQRHAQPCQQLVGAERLREIVVGA